MLTALLKSENRLFIGAVRQTYRWLRRMGEPAPA